MEGFLLKKGSEGAFSRRAWRDRWCELDGSRLTVYENFDPVNDRPINLKGTYDVSGATIVAMSHKDRKGAFEVKLKDSETLIFQAPEENMVKVWMRAFSHAAEIVPGVDPMIGHLQKLGLESEDLPFLTRSSLAKVYRMAALKVHPDKGGDVMMFKAVQEANQVIMGYVEEERSKKRYDQVYYYATLTKTTNGLGLVVNENKGQKSVLVTDILPQISIERIEGDLGIDKILPGDTLVEIRGRSVVGMGLLQVSQRLNNFRVPQGTTVTLRFMRRVLKPGEPSSDDEAALRDTSPSPLPRRLRSQSKSPVPGVNLEEGGDTQLVPVGSGASVTPSITGGLTSYPVYADDESVVPDSPTRSQSAEPIDEQLLHATDAGTAAAAMASADIPPEHTPEEQVVEEQNTTQINNQNELLIQELTHRMQVMQEESEAEKYQLQQQIQALQADVAALTQGWKEETQQFQQKLHTLTSTSTSSKEQTAKYAVELALLKDEMMISQEEITRKNDEITLLLNEHSMESSELRNETQRLQLELERLLGVRKQLEVQLQQAYVFSRITKEQLTQSMAAMVSASKRVMYGAVQSRILEPSSTELKSLLSSLELELSNIGDDRIKAAQRVAIVGASEADPSGTVFTRWTNEGSSPLDKLSLLESKLAAANIDISAAARPPAAISFGLQSNSAQSSMSSLHSRGSFPMRPPRM